MTNTPKSDSELETILAKVFQPNILFVWEFVFPMLTLAFRKAEELLIPIINQQAEEIEKLKAELETVKANDRFRTELSVNNRIITKRRLFEVMQKECPEDGEEVDKISEDTLIEAIESYIWDMRVELIAKNDALQSRFDGLLKELEALPVSMIDAHPVKMFNDDDKEPFIHRPFIDEIITKAKGQADGKV